MEVEIDLDGRLLCRVLGLGLIAQQPEEDKVDAALAGADQIVEEMFLASQDAAYQICFDLWVGCDQYSPVAAGTLNTTLAP